MELTLQFLILIVIGALIGGVTNSLAIKMLFRPYKPIYLGEWRLPFTPGLIPKRREELASQLGRLVIKHLITPESLQRKLANPAFKTEIVEWTKAKVKRLLENDDSIATMLKTHLGINNLEKTIDDKIVNSVEQRLREVLHEIEDQELQDVLPDRLLHQADEWIPELSEYIARQGAEYFESLEGKTTLKTLIDRFLEGHGMFSNMIQMFLGNDSLVDKVQEQVVKLLRQSMFREVAEELLQKEWKKVKAKKVSEFGQWINVNAIMSEMKPVLYSELPTKRILQTPVKEFSEPYSEQILSDWVPKLVGLAGQGISIQLEDMMKYLRLEDIVRDQVETFAVERLEEIVLTISKREFKMITYLGALLGGMIGLVQGTLLYFF
jgi:uncharacterized membrane protein YheB (UPF0754 family)